jgi:hypothetical protein
MDVQWAAEMRYPVRRYHSTQGDSAFLCGVRQVVKADFYDGVQGTKAGIYDPP